jgi:hypothetical protein
MFMAGNERDVWKFSRKVSKSPVQTVFREPKIPANARLAGSGSALNKIHYL